MPMTPVPAVTVIPVAHFPEKYFLENLAVRADGSVLITAVLQKELWSVPVPDPARDGPSRSWCIPSTTRSRASSKPSRTSSSSA